MRIPLLALALLLAAPALAQVDGPPYGDQNNPVPGPKLASPSTPSPDFPLQVSLRVHGNTWNGIYEYYAGHGKFQIASANSATPAAPIDFEYQCGVTFLKPEANQFQARWLKPDKTLQILLFDPERPKKPRTCNLTALAQPLPQIPGFVRHPEGVTSNAASPRAGQTPSQPLQAPSPAPHP